MMWVIAIPVAPERIDATAEIPTKSRCRQARKWRDTRRSNSPLLPSHENAGYKNRKSMFFSDFFRKVGEFTAASFPELRQAFRSADYVDGYTVFDVGGNKYRIATVIHYDKQRLYVRQVMTHAEYDRNAWRRK